MHTPCCQLAPTLALPLLQATPLQELYENRRGSHRRASIAAAVEVQQAQECTFAPDLSKAGSGAEGQGPLGGGRSIGSEVRAGAVCMKAGAGAR